MSNLQSASSGRDDPSLLMALLQRVASLHARLTGTNEALQGVLIRCYGEHGTVDAPSPKLDITSEGVAFQLQAILGQVEDRASLIDACVSSILRIA